MIRKNSQNRKDAQIPTRAPSGPPCNSEPNNTWACSPPLPLLFMPNSTLLQKFQNDTKQFFECLEVRKRRSKTRPIFRKAICMVLELVEGSCGRAKFRNSLPGASLGASFPLLTSQPLGLADRALALSDRLTGPHFDVGAPPAAASGVSTITSQSPSTMIRR